MRSLFLTIVAAAGLVACGKSARPDAPAADPKAPATEPAVVSVPLNVPMPTVSASEDVQTTSIIPADTLQRVFIVNGGYGLVAAMMINQDDRMLSGLYAATAVLRAPDTTITGNTGIARKLVALAKAKSLSDFQRSSQGMHIVDDSTLADTGIYNMTLKRNTQNVVVEHGRYATTWRARRDATKWVILNDELKPGGAGKPKGAK